jgi:hypothetical protein
MCVQVKGTEATDLLNDFDAMSRFFAEGPYSRITYKAMLEILLNKPEGVKKVISHLNN